MTTPEAMEKRNLIAQWAFDTRPILGRLAAAGAVNPDPGERVFYDEYLDEPGSKKAHELLHTHYQPREPKGIK